MSPRLPELSSLYVLRFTVYRFPLGTLHVTAEVLRGWIQDLRDGASAYAQCGSHVMAANMRQTAAEWEAMLAGTPLPVPARAAEDESTLVDGDISFTHVPTWEAEQEQRAPLDALPRLLTLIPPRTIGGGEAS